MEGEASAIDLLRRRSVRMFLGATLTSTTALIVEVTALGKLVFDLSGRELDIGWLGLAEFLPVALLVTVAGSVADRFDRRIVVRLGWAGEAVATAALAALVITGEANLVRILTLVVVFGTARAFANPAGRSLPANIVERSELPRLAALYSLSWQAAMILGPILAGLLYALDPAWPFVISAVLLAAAVAALSFVQTHQSLALGAGSAGGRLRQAVEGLSTIRTRPILLGAISLDLFAVLFGGAVALLPVLAERRLGVGAVGFGWLRAAGGIGAALMAATLALRPVRRHVGPTLFSAVAVFGVGTIVLGVTRNYVVAFVAMVVLSGADAVSVFIRSTLGPLVVPDELRGRVAAVEAVFIGASNELGAFESGIVGQWLGASAAVVAGGVCTLGVVAAGVLLFGPLRRVDRFEDLRPEMDSTPDRDR